MKKNFFDAPLACRFARAAAIIVGKFAANIPRQKGGLPSGSSQ
jgi:hypothetical protein